MICGLTVNEYMLDRPSSSASSGRARLREQSRREGRSRARGREPSLGVKADGLAGRAELQQEGPRAERRGVSPSVGRAAESQSAPASERAKEEGKTHARPGRRRRHGQVGPDVFCRLALRPAAAIAVRPTAAAAAAGGGARAVRVVERV